MPGDITFPHGLVGETANFYLEAAPRQVPELALAGAIGFLAGICGNAFNVSGTGLNQYILGIADTGVGKDAMTSGSERLAAAIQPREKEKPFPHIGPEIVSYSGLIKWFERENCFTATVGEFGKKLREWSAQRNQNGQALTRGLLQLYSKSGSRAVLQPLAYSDKDKVTKPIFSPSLTILGEAPTDNFFEGLSESLISDGFLPRFLTFEYQGKRTYLNKNAKDAAPRLELVNKLCTLLATSFEARQKGGAYEVPFYANAEAKFDEFDRYTTDLINAAGGGEAHRQLWNRAHLKALKLAALVAVGENPVQPVITIEHTMWATTLVYRQTEQFLSHFANGEIGEQGGNQIRQRDEVIRVIREYLTRPWPESKKYHGYEEMHAKGVITFAHIQQRLQPTAAFRNDRQGAQRALADTVKFLLESDILREIPRQEMVNQFGKHPRAFVASDPALIVKGFGR